MNASSWIVGLVGAVGVLIAYCQWRIAQNKLKLDLFDKRFAAYEDFKKFFDVIERSIENGEQEWVEADEEKIYYLALFLFDEEMGQLLSSTMTLFEHRIWGMSCELMLGKKQPGKEELLMLLANARLDMSKKMVSFLRIKHQVFPWSPVHRWGRIVFWIESNDTIQFYFDKFFRRK